MRALATSLALAALLAGCTPYRSYRSRGTCVAPSAVAPARLVRDPAGAGTGLRGRVVWADTGVALPGSRVTLDGREDARARTDSLGRFSFPPGAPGRHALETWRIGFMPRVDSLDLPLPPGHSVELAMFPAVMDGPCQSGPLVWVPTPWWKPW